MTWEYRVTSKTNNNGSEPVVEYGIREIYYDKDGDISGWSERQCRPYSDVSITDLRCDLQLMMWAFEKPTVDVDELDERS